MANPDRISPTEPRHNPRLSTAPHPSSVQNVSSTKFFYSKSNAAKAGNFGIPIKKTGTDSNNNDPSRQYFSSSSDPHDHAFHKFDLLYTNGKNDSTCALSTLDKLDLQKRFLSNQLLQDIRENSSNVTGPLLDNTCPALQELTSY